MTESNTSKIKDIYSLTPLQEGMLFYHLLDEKASTYFQQMTLSIDGNIDVRILEKCLNMLFRKYGILRTVFLSKKMKRPRQVVLAERIVTIHFDDISGLSESDKERFIGDFKAKDRQNGFDLSKDELFRLACIKRGLSSFVLIISFHHIILDGWCLNLLLEDLFTFYGLTLGGEEIPAYLLEEEKPFSSYIHWLETRDKTKGSAFWKNYLDGFEQTTGLPGSSVSGGGKEYRLRKYELAVDDAICSDIISKAAGIGVTVNTFIQTAWGILLQRYNNTDDAVFGLTVSGRPVGMDRVEKIVGLFINTVPVRIKTDGDTVESLLRKAQSRSIEVQEYGYLPLNEIQDGTPLRNGLLDHILVFETFPAADDFKLRDRLDFDVDSIEMYEQTNYDLCVDVLARNTLSVLFSYNENVYDETRIRTFGRQFISLLGSMASDTAKSVSDLTIMTADDLKEIMAFSSGGKKPMPEPYRFTRLVERIVDAHPDRTAIVCGNVSVSYLELNFRVNTLSRYLVSQGLLPDELVCTLLPRSPELMTSVLACWKAGAAYVPLDVKSPIARNALIVKDTNARFLITLSGIVSKEMREELGCEIVELDTLGSALAQIENTNPIDRGGELAYVIFTSGSTGKPKGTLIEQKGMVNHILAMIEFFGITENSRIAQNASPCFDISVWQFFTSLLTGGTTVIFPDEVILDSRRFLHELALKRITIVQVVPSYLRALLETLESNGTALDDLEFLIPTGEAVHPETTNRFLGLYPHVRLVNAYGPAEASDDISLHLIDKRLDSGFVSIGKPIRNINIYITDRKMRLCPVGVTGEICVSGIGVGRGYLNDVEKTHAAFGPDPFASEPGVPLYRTGDLGRWLPDGNLEFIGRRDFQVKIRGFRIELGEIESAFLKHDSVKGVIVVDRKDATGNNYLCAYVEADEKVGADSLREHVKRLVPDYMIPSSIVFLEKLPLNANGKIDRKSLPEPEVARKEYIAPATENEKAVVEVWKEVLAIEKVSTHDDFFALGGDSIKAIQIVSRLEKYGISAELRDVFQFSIARDFASHLDGYEEGSGNESIVESLMPMTIVSGENRGLILTPAADATVTELAELAMRGQDEYDRSVVSRSVCRTFGMTGMQQGYLAVTNQVETYPYKVDIPFDRCDYDTAFRTLVCEQQLLRCVLRENEGARSWAEYELPGSLSLPYADLTVIDEHERTVALNLLLEKVFTRELSLYDALLYRVLVIRTGEKGAVIYIQMNHQIYDIISTNIVRNALAQSFATIKAGKNPEPRKIALFSDYADQINMGPRAVDQKRLLEEFELSEFGKYRLIIEEKLKADESGKVTAFNHSIPFAESSDQDAVLEMAFDYINRVLASFFSVDKIPVYLLSYGRQLSNGTYYETMGDFLDLIPVLWSGADEQIDEMTDVIRKKIRFSIEHNLNFTNLSGHSLIPKWGELVELFAPSVYSSRYLMVTYNFQGKFSDAELDELNSYTEKFLGTEDPLRMGIFGSLLVQVRYSETAILFSVISTLNKNRTNELRRLFETSGQFGISTREKVM
jgi:amino acid adenylation domain-containing protein